MYLSQLQYMDWYSCPERFDIEMSYFWIQTYSLYSKGVTCQLKYIVIICPISCLYMAIFLPN